MKRELGRRGRRLGGLGVPAEPRQGRLQERPPARWVDLASPSLLNLHLGGEVREGEADRPAAVAVGGVPQEGGPSVGGPPRAAHASPGGRPAENATAYTDTAGEAESESR